MSIRQINTVSNEKASEIFRQCCTSGRWIERMVDCRPYANANSLQQAADSNWRNLKEHDYLEAFAGHPKIGDVNSLRARYASTTELAASEQSSVSAADDETLRALADGNRAYEDKFGFIFIVSATGKSAAEMLALLQARLPNDRTEELANAAEEQRKIFHIRLEKLL